MYNRITIVGNLGRDPETRDTKGGGKIVTLNVATSHIRKTQSVSYEKEVTWHRVKVFGKQGEACAQYLSQGSKVMVNGRQENGSYTKDDGTKVYTSEIIADLMGGVLFLSPKGEGGGGAKAQNPFQQGQGDTQPAPYDPGDFGPPTGQGDIPF